MPNPEAQVAVREFDHAGAPSSPNSRLVGVPGGRRQLDTQALLVDLPALVRNLDRMAAFTAARGIGLRPHVKTHKSIEIARRQIEAGATGVSCATLGEAETMVAAGVPGVLITSPIVTEGKIERLIALAGRAGPGGVLIVADHPSNAGELARAASGLSHPLDVLVDFGAGYGRTGVASARDAIDLAACIDRQAKLRLRGLQAYAGHIQHIPDRAARGEAAATLRRSVAEVIAQAASRVIAFEIVTGAGTGTHDLDAEGDVFTELQPGSYVFMDAEYTEILAGDGNATPYETALFVQTSVISTNAPDWVTVDGGTKCFATDCGVPIVFHGADLDCVYAFLGDEHGKLAVSGKRAELGTRIEFVTPHCDPTVNLHDIYHVVDGDTLVDIWRVDARGR